MPQEHSFDVVSKVNLQEVRNAVQQAQKEIATRFDFRGSSATVEFDEAEGAFRAAGDHEAQLHSVLDVLHGKLGKRGVSVKSLVWNDPEATPTGKMKRAGSLQQGLTTEKAKDIVKVVKDLGLKVQARIDGDSVRVTGKQLDELQAVIQALKAREFGVPLQFENYR